MQPSYKKFFIRAKNTLTDPIKFKRFVQTNKKELCYWVSLHLNFVILFQKSLFCVLATLTYISVSDGNFSFFLTLSGAVQMFGFLLICWKIHTSQSASGLSLQTIICYIVSFCSRLTAILTNVGYLPLDKTGDWIYQSVECCSFVLSITTLYFIQFRYKCTYNLDLDRIKCLYLIIPSLILAILFHPSLNQIWHADVRIVAWTFALYLEAVAMLPQLYIFTKKVFINGGEIENCTSHYVASQGVSRMIAFIFWIFTIEELNESVPKNFVLIPQFSGYIVFAAQLIQIVLLIDFLYNYVLSIQSGLPMTLPSYIV